MCLYTRKQVILANLLAYHPSTCPCRKHEILSNNQSSEDESSKEHIVLRLHTSTHFLKSRMGYEEHEIASLAVSDYACDCINSDLHHM